MHLTVVGQVSAGSSGDTVGGIAGQNTGSLVGCENQGDVNTTVVEVQADLSDITLLRTTESVPAGTDIGGIAGFSNGIIQSCTNEGDVGYEHMGYNVGGIAGQMEPQVIVQYSESAIEQLCTELDELETLVNKALNSAGAASSAVSGQLSGLLGQIDEAKSAAESLGSALKDHTGGGVGKLDDLASRLAWAGDRSSSVLEDLDGVTSQLTEATGWVDKALGAASQAAEGETDAAASLEEAGQRLSEAAAQSSAAVQQVQQAVQQAEGALQSGSVEGVAAELVSSLQGSVASATGTLASNIQAINTQVGVINGLIQQSVEEVQSKTDEAPVTDISDEDAEQATTGRISASVNYGEVKGDGNVAGIAGSVAIEYDFDPEDDLTESGEQSLNFEYNTLAVVLDCVNKGAVTAKKDNAGGIVGRMDVGAGAEESVVSGCCLWSSYCCWRRWARPGTSWAGLCSRPTTPTASCATSRAARTAR